MKSTQLKAISYIKVPDIPFFVVTTVVIDLKYNILLSFHQVLHTIRLARIPVSHRSLLSSKKILLILIECTLHSTWLVVFSCLLCTCSRSYPVTLPNISDVAFSFAATSCYPILNLFYFTLLFRRAIVDVNQFYNHYL